MEPRFWTLIAALSLALAGCIGGPAQDSNSDDDATLSDDVQTGAAADDTDQDDATSGEDGQDDAGDDSQDDAGTDATPIPAGLTPSLSLSSTSGPAPLIYTLTVAATGTPAGAVSWRLDGNGDTVHEISGHTLPYSATYTVTSPGAHLVSFTLDDGPHSRQETVQVTVTQEFDSGDPDFVPPPPSDDDGADEEPPIVDPGKPPTEDPGNVTADLSATPASGEAPLAVTFDMDGSGEGNLTWSLDVDDDGTEEANGTSLPAQFNHTYADAGTYTARLTVTDSNDESAEDTVTITANDPPPPPPGGSFSGETTGPCKLCDLPEPTQPGVAGALGCAGFLLGLGDEDPEVFLDCVFFELGAGDAGQPFSSSSSQNDPQVEFMSECGPTASSVQKFANAGAAESGIVPAGAGCVVLWQRATLVQANTGVTLSINIG